MLDMTNDFNFFGRARSWRRQKALILSEVTAFVAPRGNGCPLYEGKMAQIFDHRAANVVVNPENPTSSGATRSHDAATAL